MQDHERSALIERWTAKSSDSENLRMDRAERMVRNAIDAHPPFQADRRQLHVYTKGSYPNETNVRQDSDVDVVVENRVLFYSDYISQEVEAKATPDPTTSTYTGVWTPAAWRAEVENALTNYFGSDEVDSSGNVAIRVEEVPGSRRNLSTSLGQLVDRISGSGSGRLIQAVPGRSGGWGCLRTNRSGLVA
jgi:hypothetical protein